MLPIKDMFKFYADENPAVLIDSRFSEILHQFRGATLQVFMCLLMHADKNGQCSPSYNLIMEETGLSRSTLAEALNALTALKIDERRVLSRTNIMSDKGKSANLYVIFPSD